MPITRGELIDKVTLYALQSPENWNATVKDVKGVIKEQFDLDFPPDFKVELLFDSRSTLHLTLPYLPDRTADLTDEDLESIAGGFLDTTVGTCIVLSSGASAVVI